MADNAHLIIDGRKEGLPHAPGYYAVFPLEPSPLGDLSLATGRTTVMGQDSSLESALDAMIRAGSGAIVMLICHAFQNGLLLPIAAGAKKALAVVANMATLDQMIAAEAEAARIRLLPTTTPQEQKAVIDAWTKLLNGLQPGAVSGTFTTAEAEAFYARFLDMVGGKLELGDKAGLRRLLAKVLRVRALKLPRLELRACKLGDDKTSMEAVRKFFAAAKLTAPIASTFYLSPVPVSTISQFGRQPVKSRGVRGSARVPGPIANEVIGSHDILMQEGHTTRGFLRRTTIPIDFSGGRLSLHLDAPVSHFTFLLRIDEVTFASFKASAAVASTGDGVTQDWKIVRAFVNGWVMPGSSFQMGAFPLAGFTTPDMDDQPFVLPNETSYMRLLEQVP